MCFVCIFTGERGVADNLSIQTRHMCFLRDHVIDHVEPMQLTDHSKHYALITFCRLPSSAVHKAPTGGKKSSVHKALDPCPNNHDMLRSLKSSIVDSQTLRMSGPCYRPDNARSTSCETKAMGMDNTCEQKKITIVNTQS